jgi:predicted nucleotide-binding protein (sugar kinase/HSP70/actin superfamily)
MGKPTELDIEAELAKFEAEERARLSMSETKEQWTDEMIDPQFAASQRPETTVLLGGLTMAHDYLVEGALKGIGYQAKMLEVPDHESLRYGKEFGNRGQCNPTYFTVGNLVKSLDEIRVAEGLTHQQVVDSHIFVTAGACGPCRFGMYVTEYRKALRDGGYDGFRVMLFQQTGGLKQATGEEAGLLLNPTFFGAVAKALFSGDVINAISYRIRPYEKVKGATDIALQKVKDEVYAALESRTNVVLALYRARKYLAAVEVNRLQAKPKVSILGEFWAMTTEGEGNHFLQRFVEEEGGEDTIQLIANLLLYNIWEFQFDTKERATLRGADGGKFGLEKTDVGLLLAALYLAELAVRGIFKTFGWAIGLRDYPLPDMDEVAKVGHSHYNVNLRGGEGHMEVAKLILNVVKQKAHMTISVKPFGCMPSSGVSDGVQSVITEILPEAIFCPVETSGDAAVNFHSRVQMYLFKARQRATEEYTETLEKYGVTQAQLDAFIAEHPKYGTPFYHPPHVVAGTAADIVHEIAPLIGKSRLGRARVHATRAVTRSKKWLGHDGKFWVKKVRDMAPYLPSVARFVAVEAAEALPRPNKLWNDVMNRFIGQTAEERELVRKAEADLAMLDEVKSKPVADKSDRRLQVMA